MEKIINDFCNQCGVAIPMNFAKDLAAKLKVKQDVKYDWVGTGFDLKQCLIPTTKNEILINRERIEVPAEKKISIKIILGEVS